MVHYLLLLKTSFAVFLNSILLQKGFVFNFEKKNNCGHIDFQGIFVGMMEHNGHNKLAIHDNGWLFAASHLLHPAWNILQQLETKDKNGSTSAYQQVIHLSIEICPCSAKWLLFIPFYVLYNVF